MSSDKGRIKAIDTTSVHKICSGQVRPVTAGAAEEGLAKWMEHLVLGEYCLGGGGPGVQPHEPTHRANRACW